MRVDLSANDARSYRYVKLDNGLQVVFVSGTSTDGDENSVLTSGTACAITFPLGSFTDPKDAAGLSDLIRRTLVQEIQEDLSNNTHLDAYTNNEWTTFYADMEPKRLGTSLDTIVKHLCNPKFETKHIEIQLMTMEQDYKRAKIKDEIILRHFIANLTKSQSPFRNAKKGTMATLLNGPGRSLGNLRSMMLQHLTVALDPQRMTFAAESITDTLDGLEIAVQQTLVKFKSSKNSKPINYAKYSDSFDTEEFQKFYEIIPVRGKDQLRLIWSLPCLQDFYRSNPMLVLSSLIRNLQEGGVAHRLEEEHLATDLECVFGTLCDFTNNSMNTLFMIRMHLTQTGSHRVSQICDIVYEYLKFLEAEASKCLKEPEGQSTWNFLWKDVPHTFRTYVQELKILREEQFIKQPVLCPQVTAVWLANMMRKVNTQDLYTGYQLIHEPDMKIYHNLLSDLASKSCCIIQCSHELESNVKRTAELKTDQYYNTRYAVNDLPESLDDSIQTTQCSLNFSLPARNRNAAGHFANLPCSNGIKKPTNLNDSPQRSQWEKYGALWYEPLTFFTPPKGIIMLQLSSHVPLESERNATLLMLFAEDVRQNMQEMHTNPSSTRMSYNIHTMDNNVFLSLCGPTEHLREFYSFLIKKVFMLCSKMDLDQFDERRKRVQTFIDHAKVSPEQLADNILQFLTKNPAFLFTDQLNDFPKLTIADLMAFSSQLLCQLSVNMYVAGTVSEEDAKSVYDRTVRAIGCIPLSKKKEMAALVFAPGTYHYKTDGQSTDSLNGTYYFVRYSICSRGDALSEACNRILVALFKQYITQFLYSENSSNVIIEVQLKRKFFGFKGNSAIQVSIRSDDPEKAEEYWLSRVAAFWYRIAPLLIVSLSDTKMQALRNSVTAQLNRKSSGLEEHTTSVWETVIKWDAKFEFIEEIAEKLARITQADLFKFFFDNYLDLNQQRTIILEITPNRSKRPMHKRSFRHQFSRAADVLEDEVSKFMSLQKIDPHIGESHAGEQFKLIGRFYPERMKTIHDLHVFRDQWLSRRPD